MWEDDAVKKKIMFGRSKQHRKVIHQAEAVAGEKRELTLSQLIAEKNKNYWVKFETNKFYFLNWHSCDFDTAEPSMDQLWLADESMFELLHCGTPSENLELAMDDSFDMVPSIPRNYFVKYDQEQLIFNYMVSTILPNCTCYGENFISFNPYLNFIIPLSMHSAVLFKSVLAASAIAYASTTGDKSYLKTAQFYTREVLRALPSLIDSKLQTHSTHWDEILATIIMLCIAEITFKCDEAWLLHLSRGKTLLKHRHILTSSNSLFLKFFIRYITSHDIMWETVRKPLSNWIWESEVDDLYENMKNDSDKRIDIVLGCSPYLLTLINKISELGDNYETLENEVPANRVRLEKLILQNTQCLQNELEKLEQVTVIKLESGNVDLADAERIAEIKRLTAMIYLHARIHIVKYKLHVKDLSCVAEFRDKTLAINRISKTIIESMKKVSYSSMAVLWPLFVLGLVSCDQDDRWFILNRFNEMEKHRGLASITRARETVENVWKLQDLNDSKIYTWKELIGYQTDTLSLA